VTTRPSLPFPLRQKHTILVHINRASCAERFSSSAYLYTVFRVSANYTLVNQRVFIEQGIKSPDNAVLDDYIRQVLAVTYSNMLREYLGSDGKFTLLATYRFPDE
jgi:hypothetical protein